MGTPLPPSLFWGVAFPRGKKKREKEENTLAPTQTPRLLGALGGLSGELSEGDVPEAASFHVPEAAPVVPKRPPPF